MNELILDIFGLPADWNVILKFASRSVVVFILALIFVRINGKRMFTKSSAFDFVVAIMLGSVLSRAITASAPFWPTIIAGAVLMFVHWLFSYIAFRHSWFGRLVKGNETCLIKDGKMQHEAMRQASITRHDLQTAARTQSKLDDLEQVKDAYLERNGYISIIPFEERS